MKLKVIGSGSSGNCYLLDDGKQILIIEAGLPFSEVKEAINYQTSRIVGVLSTHEHGDHRKFIDEYIKAGIPVMKGNVYYPLYNPLTKLLNMYVGDELELGEYIIAPFDVPHDVPCYGYVIHHPAMGKLIFVTDAEYVKYTFPGVNHIMVETNYSQDILDENTNSGEIPTVLRNRIMKSHMSFDTAVKMVKANKSSQLRNVVMCHLSTRNSNKSRFKEDMQNVVGSFCNVTIAKKGTEVDLNLIPF